MQPNGQLHLLFQAYSRITGTAFLNSRLLCCPTLSKAPNYGNVVHHFAAGAAPAAPTVQQWVRLLGRYLVTNLGHFAFLLLTKLFVVLLRFSPPSRLFSPTKISGTSSCAAHNAPLDTALSPAQQHTAHGTPRPLLILETFALLPKLATEGRYEEMYLAGAWEAAHGAGLAPIRLFKLYGSRSPRTLWHALGVLSQSGPAMTEAHLLRWSDYAALLWHIIAYPFALFQLIRQLAHSAKGSPEAAIHNALVESAGQCVLGGEAWRLAAIRLGEKLAHLPAPGNEAPRILSWHENQTLNKVFYSGIRTGFAQHANSYARAPMPTLIGAQLFTWPVALLNNHPDDGEAALGLAPDITVVTGPAFLPEQSCQRFVVGPALRYRHLFPLNSETLLQNPLPGSCKEDTAKNTSTQPAAQKPSLPLPLLVLLSYHPEETLRVLEMVKPLAAVPGAVAYKFHPATQPKAFAEHLPQNPVLVTSPLGQALAGAAAVIGSGSGALAEAVCLGCPVLAVAPPVQADLLGLNYLPAFGEGCLWAGVTTPQDVPRQLEKLQAFQKTVEYAPAREQFTELLFTRPTPEAVQALLLLR